MVNKSFEINMVRHCSATLAGLKIANYYCVQDREQITQYLKSWNENLNYYGLRFIKLCNCTERIGIYVFQEELLGNYLCKKETQKFLKSYAYDSFSCDDCLKRLHKRMAAFSLGHIDEFPHEFGIFLGYPLADVISFIENKGKNELMTGPWKVYHDLDSAKKCFKSYKRCCRLFMEILARGNTLPQAICKVRAYLNLEQVAV